MLCVIFFIASGVSIKLKPGLGGKINLCQLIYDLNDDDEFGL